jgi:hypothetical protein
MQQSYNVYPGFKSNLHTNDIREIGVGESAWTNARGTDVTNSGGNLIMRGFIICSFHQKWLR